MGTWVALVLALSGGPAALETRYFDSSGECEAWARRISTPAVAVRPGSGHLLAACFQVRELIGRLAQG